MMWIFVDSQNRILATNKNNMDGNTGWIETTKTIPKQLIDDRGIALYKLVDGAPVLRSAAEMDLDYIPLQQEPTAEARIAELEEKNKQLEEALDLLLSGTTEVEANA